MSQEIQTTSTAPSVLQVNGVGKRYAKFDSGLARLLHWIGIPTKASSEYWANRDISFTVQSGQAVAIIGQNGAGKSTLVRILSGTEAPDDGSIFIEGKEVKFATPIDAREVGIETVFQDLALCPHLSPVQNLFLGREIPRKGLLGKFGFLDNEKMKKISADAFKDLGATVRSLLSSG